jgi:hypothetical protein
MPARRKKVKTVEEVANDGKFVAYCAEVRRGNPILPGARSLPSNPNMLVPDDLRKNGVQYTCVLCQTPTQDPRWLTFSHSPYLSSPLCATCPMPA